MYIFHVLKLVDNLFYLVTKFLSASENRGLTLMKFAGWQPGTTSKIMPPISVATLQEYGMLWHFLIWLLCKKTLYHVSTFGTRCRLSITNRRSCKMLWHMKEDRGIWCLMGPMVPYHMETKSEQHFINKHVIEPW